MAQHSIQRILNAHQWTEEEAPISFLLLDYYKNCYLYTKEAHGTRLFHIALYYVHNSYGYEWSSATERKHALVWMQRMLEQNPSFFKIRDVVFVDIAKRTKTLFDEIHSTDVSAVSDKKLATYLKRAGNIAIEQYGYSIITEAADVLSEDDYLAAFPDVPVASIPDVVRSLGVPARNSYLELFHRALYILTLACKKEFAGRQFPKTLTSLRALRPALGKKIERFSHAFHWIDNSFKRYAYVAPEDMYKKIVATHRAQTTAELQKEIQSIAQKIAFIKKDQSRVRRRYKISKKGKNLLTIIAYLTGLQDRRKELVLRFGSVLAVLLQEISRRTQVPRTQLEYYDKEDMQELLLNGRRVTPSLLTKRKKILTCSFYKNKKLHTIQLYGAQADSVLRFFKEQKNQLRGQDTRGFVASVGTTGHTVRGKVKVLFDPDNGTIQKGEILVTGMTRPEFLPLMKQAKAVITNEGGITTHAAITSRELGIPCIIGTKNATDVFRTGDLVEMDMRRGTIKKCKA